MTYWSLSPMKAVRVDPGAGTARAAGGVLLGELDQATQRFGLAVPSGIVSHTGIGGLTLGGGLGRTIRRCPTPPGSSWAAPPARSTPTPPPSAGAATGSSSASSPPGHRPTPTGIGTWPGSATAGRPCAPQRRPVSAPPLRRGRGRGRGRLRRPPQAPHGPQGPLRPGQPVPHERQHPAHSSTLGVGLLAALEHLDEPGDPAGAGLGALGVLDAVQDRVPIGAVQRLEEVPGGRARRQRL